MWMRISIAIVAAFVLAACQQQPNATPATTAAHPSEYPLGWQPLEAAKGIEYFPTELGEVRKQMITGLLTRCYAHISDHPAMDACIRQGLVQAFDDSGEGGRKCAAISDLDQYTDCVVTGNLVVDLIHHLDPAAKVDPDVWAGRQSLSEAIKKQVLIAGVVNCGDRKTADAAASCMYDWLGARLAIPDALMERCSPGLESGERGRCIGQAASIRFLREHLPRLSATGT